MVFAMMDASAAMASMGEMSAPRKLMTEKLVNALNGIGKERAHGTLELNEGESEYVWEQVQKILADSMSNRPNSISAEIVSPFKWAAGRYGSKPSMFFDVDNKTLRATLYPNDVKRRCDLLLSTNRPDRILMAQQREGGWYIYPYALSARGKDTAVSAVNFGDAKAMGLSGEISIGNRKQVVDQPDPLQKRGIVWRGIDSVARTFDRLLRTRYDSIDRRREIGKERAAQELAPIEDMLKNNITRLQDAIAQAGARALATESDTEVKGLMAKLSAWKDGNNRLLTLDGSTYKVGDLLAAKSSDHPVNGWRDEYDHSRHLIVEAVPGKVIVEYAFVEANNVVDRSRGAMYFSEVGADNKPVRRYRIDFAVETTAKGDKILAIERAGDGEKAKANIQEVKYMKAADNSGRDVTRYVR